LEKSEGIVLKALNYQENSRIVTLFTDDGGIIQLIIKGISHKNSDKLRLSSLLTRGEYLYIKGRSSLYLFQDGTVLEEPLYLRERWGYIKTAGEIVQIILKSQMVGKPAPLLYQLFVAYLKQIPFFEDPNGLIGSFYVKLLQHEGVLPERQFSYLSQIRSFNELKKIELSPDELCAIKAFYLTTLEL